MTQLFAAQDVGEGSDHRLITLCGQPACVAAWNALVQDSDLAASLGDADGRYIFVSRAFAEILGTSPAAVVGTSVRDWFVKEMAEERIAARRQVLRTSYRLRAVDIVRGRRFLVTFRAAEIAEHKGCVLAVLAPRSADARDLATIHFRHVDLGPLASLTRRELEILKMIGEGRAQREIAERLQRTVKTVEAHRAALGRKLGVKKNVQLVQIAMAAGLLDPTPSFDADADSLPHSRII